MMPRQLSILIGGAIFLLGLGASCKDKSEPGYCAQYPGSCTTVATAKDFFLFKEGSWWVYEEATTHERDSMYVTHYSNGSGYDFDCRIKSALTDYEYHYWPLYASGNTQCSSTGLNAAKCIFIKESKGKPGDYVGEGYCFFLNYKNGGELASFNVDYTDNKISVAHLYSTYEPGSFSFDEVVKMHERGAVLDNDQPKNNYYAKGIGLIRKELVDSNQVWNLVSYYIEL